MGVGLGVCSIPQWSTAVEFFEERFWLHEYLSGSSGEYDSNHSFSSAFCTRILLRLWRMKKIKCFIVFVPIF